MAKKDFARLAWNMASWEELDRFDGLENGTKWVWFETVMTLDAMAGQGPFYWDQLLDVLNITELSLKRQVDILVSRGLLRRDGPNDLSLPSELKISPAHKAAKIVVRRPPPALVAVGGEG